MGNYKRKLVTVICEAILEKKIVKVSHDAGIIGYTVIPAAGEGAWGVRRGDFEHNKNVKIEILCDDEKAKIICDSISEKFFENYAIIVYLSDVTVLRPDKFS